MKRKQGSEGQRWGQLVLGVIVMMMISSPQYTWTLFVHPIQQHLGGSLVALQFTFSILIILQTWFSPLQGYLVDRFGPRWLISAGSLMAGLSWVLSAQAQNIGTLYLFYGVIGGLGTGIVYVGTIGMMVRWFPDKRGLASGITAAGYGFGAILTTFPISHMLHTSNYQKTLVLFGILQAVIGVAAAQGLRSPKNTVQVPKSDSTDDLSSPVSGSRRQSVISYKPSQMLRTPIFWLMFLMMSLLSTSGLMVTSEVGPFSQDFGVSTALVLGMGALPLSLTLSRFTNGLTRPFFGWVSDRIGRENTMLVAFVLEALSIFLLVLLSHQPVAFVLLTGVVFFGWGEIFSLFPSTLTDLFGPKYATINYGFLYIAQGVGSLLGGPASAMLKTVTGSWTPVFLLVAGLDIVTAILAVLVLKPMRVQWVESSLTGGGLDNTKSGRASSSYSSSL